MKTIVTGCVLLSALFPFTALADGLTFGGTIAVTSNYLSDGVTLSDGKPAIQPFFEVSNDGYYGNIWASNIKDEDGNNAAVDLSAGYRGDIAGNLSYDVGYTQHLFDKTHSYQAEIDGTLDYTLTDQLTLSGEVDYDLAAHTFAETISAEYDLGNGWLAHGEVGEPDPSSPVFWGAGVGYALADKVGLDLQYQDTTSSKGAVALTMTYAFGGGE